jgi:hypothetical protein
MRTDDDHIEACIVDLELVIFSYRSGALSLQQFITRLAQAVKRIAQAAGDGV